MVDLTADHKRAVRQMRVQHSKEISALQEGYGQATAALEKENHQLSKQLQMAWNQVSRNHCLLCYIVHESDSWVAAWWQLEKATEASLQSKAVREARSDFERQVRDLRQHYLERSRALSRLNSDLKGSISDLQTELDQTTATHHAKEASLKRSLHDQHRAAHVLARTLGQYQAQKRAARQVSHLGLST